MDHVAAVQSATFRNERRFQGSVAEILDKSCRLLKPSTYMNRSGLSVSSLLRYFRIPVKALLLVHDELDLPAGVARLKDGGGAGGHNGLSDVIAALGERDFWRLRIGIGRPASGMSGSSYVLRQPDTGQQQAIEAALSRVYEHLPGILSGEYQRVMNALHRSEPVTPDQEQD